MQNKHSLQELLAETVERMTSDQVKVFRRELKKSLPIVVKECDRKATETTRSDAEK